LWKDATLNYANLLYLGGEDFFWNGENYKTLTNQWRLTNLTTLRPSLRNTIVNYNAFQKVFRTRFDESKANVTTLNFSTLGEKQPFLSDGKTPYLKFLRKNTESFYRTPFYSTKLFL
jgi:hypothetical protein